MFWECLPSSVNLVSESDLLRAKRALLLMRKKEKWMTVSRLYTLQRELTYLLTCGRHSLVPVTQNDLVVGCITL